MPSDIKFIAKTYIDAGWAVVPIVAGEKRASGSWQKKQYTPADFKPSDGIAGKCGEPSGWRVDVDCDAHEAIVAAKALIPTTHLIHGRQSKPDSHYWYNCVGAKTAQFTDAREATGATVMLVEIRSSGGYTVLPPSRHPSGEDLVWTVERAPLVIEPEALYEAVRAVATAALIARHYPASGARHALAGPLAGFLSRAGVAAPLILEIMKTAAEIAKDGDVQDRLKYARTTLAKAREGTPTTGGPKLVEAFGESVVDRLRNWYRQADTEALDQMNAKHFWVRMGRDDAIGREDGSHGVVFQRPKSLYTEYANQLVKIADDQKGNAKYAPLFETWLKSPSRRSFREVVFAPPPLQADPRDYNLWTGFAVEPKEGDCGRFLDHLGQVICAGNSEWYEYLLDLVALTCQQPGVPTQVATVLRGEVGTGKGMFVRALGKLFGKHFVHLDNVKHLVGDFNASISGKIIVFADEAFWAGDKREVGALKRIITEPTLSITRKGIDTTQEQNCVHLFMATNEEWSVPATLHERRFFALKVAKTRMQDKAYFDAIEQELEAGGLAAFLQMMLTRPTSFDKIRKAPHTDELRTQQSKSLSPLLEWWSECLYRGMIGAMEWPDKISSSDLYECYFSWIERRRFGRFLSVIEFGRQIADYVSRKPSIVFRSSGAKIRGFEVRGLGDARDFFDLQAGSAMEWPDDLSTKNKTPTIL